VTIGQYAAFLNAAAKSDPYSLYSTSMATDLNSAGISRTGASGSYTYSVIGPAGSTPAGASSPGNRPIAYVSWFDAARFANWMHNGQGSGSTETGAYTLNGATSGTAPARNAGAQFYLPTENQWYKAAYYKGGGTNAGYWDYATQSDTDPGNTIGSAANQANYINSVYSVTRSSSYSSGQNYLTEVGAYTNSQSAYGTFDQSGNVMEWNDLTGAAGTSRGLRGGGWDWNGAISLSSPFRVTDATSADSYFIGNGFRLASPVAVPEPSTWVMGLAGIACAGWRAVRRRTRGRGGRSLTVKVSPNLLAGGMRRKLPIGGISASLALVRTKSVREKSPRRRLFAPSSFRFFVATCGILAAELLSSGPADAGSIAIAVPTAAATTTGSSSWGFGYYGSQQVAQNLFPSSELVGMNVGDTILGLTIRSPYFPFPGSSFSPYTFPQFDISVGRGKASLGSVFADNFHSPPTTVRTGSLTVGQGFFQGPLNFGTMISFDTPYVYSGGNLLIELRTKSAQIGFDADLMVAGQTSGQLAYAFGSTSATNATGIENYNFAMQLNVSPVPEPSTWAMGLAGLAYGGFSLWRRRKAKAALAVALVSLAVAGSEPALAGPVSGPMADVVFGNLGASGNNALGGLSTSAIDAGPDGTRIAVSFVTGSDGPWTLGSLRLGIGSPTNDPVPFALITGDDGGTPSLSTVAAFYSIPGEGSSITTTGFYDFTPTFAAELQASTTYWLFVGNDSPEASSFGWYGNAAAASPTAQNDSGWSFGATKISFDGGSTWGGYSAGNSVAFSIAAVPEPSTYALTLAGIACAGWHVTRRQKRLAKKVTATKSGWLCRCRGLQSV
jgi:formylglycine-generating enzyme required for sulfatase activity